ncbi:deoxyguanosinetriphosphate triphosphohydrolase family protein [uncultured Amnibacterium sp.]|uniref:deoxyguanosinetriphosphate triphosphohydrolase family protein n=1 Tax=uncultured Amnibacterium sp. TaxID=1631851 RepID=UPI0035C96126
MNSSASDDQDALKTRFYAEDAELVWRSEAERDADRLLYSTAFRRLDGVTQVASAGEVALLHNRLTHSLKVGQVGRKIAASINFQANKSEPVRQAIRKFTGVPFNADRREAIDPWVLEAAGMAHDLGHPPFGHIAEQVLQKALGKTPNQNELLPVPEGFSLDDSFEGNAQSLRIVTRLAFGRLSGVLQSGAGLNLTRATTSAVLKYPWRRNARPSEVDLRKEKWGAYDSEADVLEWATDAIDDSVRRERPDGSLEWRSVTAQAMDWADDITYAVHDVEDFCRARLIPADLLSLSEFDAPLIQGFWQYCLARLLDNSLILSKIDGGQDSIEPALRAIFLGVLRGLPGSTQATRLEREEFRKWSSERIEFYTSPRPQGIQVLPDTGFLDIALRPLVEVEILKKLTWYFVIERPALGSTQRGQAKMIRELFVWLCEWSEREYPGPQYKTSGVSRTQYNVGGLPPRLIDYLDVTSWQQPDTGGYRSERERVARAVCDYISSLTEKQALDLHIRLNGASSVAILDNWVQF